MAIWSAGCCNGEEPYSIAIILEQLSESAVLHQGAAILASDRRPEVLKRARRGQYAAGALKELTEPEIRKYFRYLPDRPREGRSFICGENRSFIFPKDRSFNSRENWMSIRQNSEDKYDIRNSAGKNSDCFCEPYEVGEKLRQYINFEQRDIRRSLPGGIFDLVFCRNMVFTYFDKKYQQWFLDWLEEHLKPEGFLILGNNESLPEISWLKKETQRHPIYKKI